MTRARGRHVPGRMNGTEAEYALILEAKKRRGEIADYRFEPLKLILADRTTYTPDFLVLTDELEVQFVEVKGGFVREDGWLKLKLAARQYPWFRFQQAQKKKQSWTFTEVAA